MSFWPYEFRKTWLDKCLKSHVLKDPSRSKMVNSLKHGSKLNKSNCTISINPFQDNSGLKNLSAWYGKPYHSLSINWQPMTSILFLTEAIYCNFFRCTYPRNAKYCLNFFLHFLNLEWTLSILNKTMTILAHVLFNLRFPKNVLREMSKKSHFIGPFSK